jgi:hypothetical protein
VAFALAAGGAAVTVTGVGERLLYALRHGICTVGSVLCPPPPPPCVIARDAQRDSGSVTVGVVRVGEDQALVIERLSNGKVAVTLVGGGHGGVDVGLGVGGHVQAGGEALGAGAEVRAAVIARLGGGKEWILPNEAAARKLVDALGQGQTIPLVDTPAQAIDDLFGGGEDVRPPDVEWQEAGSGGEAHAVGEAGSALVSARVAASEAIGSRIDHRTGERTLYLRLDDASSAALSLKLLGAGAAGAGSTSVAVTLDRHGTPVELVATAFRQLEDSLQLPPGLSTPKVLAHAGANAASGRRLEVEARLDLQSPANAEATKALLAAMADPSDLPGRVAAVARLGERLIDGARIDARLYGLDSQNYGAGGRARVGIGFGAALDHRLEQTRLLAAWQRPPDGAWTDRRDCLDAARKLAA